MTSSDVDRDRKTSNGSASLLWYLTDRFQASFSRANATSKNAKCSVMIQIVAKSGQMHYSTRNFRFRPGQYVFIAIKTIDLRWHPFSIASDPREETIDFYVEVMNTSKVDGSDS